MSNDQYSRWIGACVLLLIGTAFVTEAALPHGWLLRGSKPSEFEVGIDTDQSYQGRASAYLKSKGLNVDGFGTLMQSIKAEQYVGKKVRLSGLVKSEEVQGWSGL